MYPATTFRHAAVGVKSETLESAQGNGDLKIS